MIYTRTSGNVVFICPTVAISVADDWWVELAWLNFAIGIRRIE